MQDYHLYEYAVIRVMPRVEREEFINIGVMLYCSASKFLASKIEVNEARLLALYPNLDLPTLHEYIKAFQQVCQGGKNAGAIGQLPIAERYRWLSATRSTILQASKVHVGYCKSPQATLDRLFEQLVN